MVVEVSIRIDTLALTPQPPRVMIHQLKKPEMKFTLRHRCFPSVFPRTHKRFVIERGSRTRTKIVPTVILILRVIAPRLPPQSVAGVTELVAVRIYDRQDHPVRIVEQFSVTRVLFDQLADDVGRHSGADPFACVHACRMWGQFEREREREREREKCRVTGQDHVKPSMEILGSQRCIETTNLQKKAIYRFSNFQLFPAITTS